MNDSRPTSSQAFLSFTADKSTDLSDGFAALTGYSRDAVLGTDRAEILELLRVPREACEKLALDGSADCYLFTKALEPREVTISVLPEQEGLRYTFEEHPNSRLEDKIIFIEHVFTENKIGAAIYSVPELILLKTNARYLEDGEESFGEITQPIGRSLQALMPDFEGSETQAQWHKVLNTAQVQQVRQYETKNTQGHMTYWDIIHTPIFENGRMKYIYTTHEDVTRRVLAKQRNLRYEKALKLEKEKLESIIFNMSDPMVIFNQDGVIDIINKTARNLMKAFKINAQKIAEVQEIIEYYDAEDRKIPPDEVPPLRVLRGEILVDFRVKIKQSEQCFYADINGSPIYDKDGSVLFAVLCLRNITEKVSNDAVIQYQANLLQNISDMIISTDERFIIMSWNKAAERAYGWTEEEAIGQDVRILLQFQVRGTAYREIINQLLEKDRIEVEDIHMSKDGRSLNVVSAVELLKNSRGELKGAVAIIHDITEQKKLLEVQQKNELRLRSVLENSGDIIYSQNMQTKRYEYVSPACQTVLGYTPEEFMAMNVETTFATIHPEDLPAFLESLKVLDEKGKNELVYRQRTKSGDYRWYSNRLSVVRDEAGCVLYRFGNIHDITQWVEDHAFIRYQANLLQNISDMIISTDDNFVIQSWNKAAERTLGWTAEEAIGQNVRALLQSVQTESTFEETFGRLFEQGGKVDTEIIQTCKDGRKIDALTSFELLKNSKGDITGTVGIFRDITEQKKLLKVLQKSDLRLREVLENTGDVIYSQNMQTIQYEYLSPAIETLLGYTPEEFMAIDAKMTNASIHPLDRAAFVAAFEELDEKGVQELKYRQRTKSGDYRWFSNRLSVIKDEAGRVLYRFGNIHDITEQVENEALIRYQASLLQNISDIIISTDENGDIKSWNKAAERIYGWTEKEVLGKNIRQLLETKVIDNTYDERMKLLYEKGKVEFEVVYTRKDGTNVYARNTLELLKDSDGRVIGTIGIFRDITAQKEAEDALRERDMHLRLAAEGVCLGTYSVNSVTGEYFLSDALKALWGLKPNDIARVDEDNLYIGLHPDDKQGFLDQIAASNDPKGNGIFDFDYRVIRPDGTIRWLHVRGQTTFGGAGESRHPLYTAGVVIDVTERIEAEASIREITCELRNVMESTQDYIFSIDKNYRLVFFNSAFGRYIEQNLGQQLKRGVLMTDVLPMLGTTVFEDTFAQVAKEGKVQIETSVENGRVLAFVINPVFTDAQLVEITVFAKDITARVNGEREIIRLNSSLEKRVHERTIELEKSVSALQNLSRLISHDMKEPIREIEVYAKQLCQDEAAKPYASKIKKTCRTMLEMVQDLSKYAMSSERQIQKQTINVKKMITSIYSELKPTITNSSILQFESGLPIVAADQVLLHQVLYNLLSNAVKFSSKRETSRITLGCVEEQNDYVFYIKDNGVGFDMQYAHKLFNIFERLHSKEEFEGTGIGLAAVRNIIQRHGGRTWIESQEQVGTVVYFTLPIAAEA